MQLNIISNAQNHFSCMPFTICKELTIYSVNTLYSESIGADDLFRDDYDTAIFNTS